MSQSKYTVNHRLKQIKSILKTNPRGLTIGELAQAIHANRNSVAKYLDVLLVSGQVDLKNVGRAKLYYLSQRIPLSALLDISSDYIIVYNSKLQLVQVNDQFRWFLQKAQRTALVEPGHPLTAEFFLNEFAIKNNITEALNGQESTGEITFQLIEKDSQLIAALEEKCREPWFSVFHEDILRFDFLKRAAACGKKIKVVQGIADALGLKNVRAEQNRVEKVKDKFDFVVSRAVTAFPRFVGLVHKNISHENKNAILNGILYLKGGDFKDEIKRYGTKVEIFEIPDLFEEPFFETKKVIYLPL